MMARYRRTPVATIPAVAAPVPIAAIATVAPGFRLR
jgi:hypothetical protein